MRGAGAFASTFGSTPKITLGEAAVLRSPRKNFQNYEKKKKLQMEEFIKTRLKRLKELGELPADTCSDKEFAEFLRLMNVKEKNIKKLLIEREEALIGQNSAQFFSFPCVLLKDLRWCLETEKHQEALPVFFTWGAGGCPSCSEHIQRSLDEWTEYHDLPAGYGGGFF